MIRPANNTDRDAVFAGATSLSLSGPVDRDAFDAQFAHALSAPSSTLLVAEYVDRPCGYLLGTVAPMFVYNGGMAFVQELFVEEHVRRRGIATALMSAFEGIARGDGATVTALATSRAGALYDALGFMTKAAYYTRATSS